MSFQLVGVYDGTQEAKANLRTLYRPVTGELGTAVVQASTVGSFPASLSGLPGAGGNLKLVVGSGLIGLVVGVLIGRSWRQ